MKLNKLKYVELVRKGIYSQELHHYSGLCKIYESLFKSKIFTPQGISKTMIEKTLSSLDRAAKGDYSYLEENPNLSQFEVDIFKKFAYHSQKLEQYKTADTLLKNAIDVDAKTQKTMISSAALQNFNTFMAKTIDCETKSEYIPSFKNPNYLNYHTSTSFINSIAEHSPRWLGHIYYKLSKNATELIKSVDQSHLPDKFHIEKTLTPASFGAEITGFIGNVQRFFEKFKKKDKTVEILNQVNEEDAKSVNLEDYNPFTQREAKYFKNKPSNVHEIAYNFVTAHKGALSRAALATAALTVLISATAFASPAISQARDFNAATAVSQVQVSEFTTPISVNELNSIIDDFETQHYTNIDDFKEDANYSLDAIEQTCQTYLKQYQIPTLDEVQSILGNLDDVTSILIEKPVEFAYQEKYPEFSNFEADLYYDDTVTDYTNLYNKITEEGVKITATDPNGNQISTKIPNIGNPLGANDLFRRVLTQERDYDKEFKDFFEAISNPEAINPETNKTYTYSEIRDLYNNFFTNIMNDCEMARTLTIPNIEIQSDGTFRFVLPQKEQEASEVETQSTTSNTEVTKEYIENEDGTTSVRYVKEDDGR